MNGIPCTRRMHLKAVEYFKSVVGPSSVVRKAELLTFSQLLLAVDLSTGRDYSPKASRGFVLQPRGRSHQPPPTRPFLPLYLLVSPAAHEIHLDFCVEVPSLRKGYYMKSVIILCWGALLTTRKGTNKIQITVDISVYLSRCSFIERKGYIKSRLNIFCEGTLSTQRV